MDWWLALLVILGCLILLMASGLHTAICFMLVSTVGVYLLFNGEAGLRQLIINISSSVTMFSILPIILFVLMGSILFQSGVATHVIEAVNKLLGRLPGRLSLLAVLAGTLFAALSGSSMGSTAMLGSSLVPEMERQGYQKPMTLGPILGSGPLAIMIPPTSLGVFIAVIAEISVGKLLISIIVPGLLVAVCIASYVLIRCWLQPSLAPAYETAHYSLSEKAFDFAKYVLPLGIIVFLVTGLIFLGIATPSESAAVGCFGSILLAAAYGRLNLRVINLAFSATVRTAVMVLFIMASAIAFSQILAFSGASQGLIKFVLGLELPRILIVICMQIIVLAMGCFMDVSGIIMITVPMFMPVIKGLGFDPLWFVTVMLLNIEMAVISPPFGLTLFVMKGVAPRGTTMEDVYKAAMPYLGLNLLVMALLIAFPVLAQWLPNLMK